MRLARDRKCSHRPARSLANRETPNGPVPAPGSLVTDGIAASNTQVSRLFRTVGTSRRALKRLSAAPCLHARPRFVRYSSAESVRSVGRRTVRSPVLAIALSRHFRRTRVKSVRAVAASLRCAASSTVEFRHHSTARSTTAPGSRVVAVIATLLKRPADVDTALSSSRGGTVVEAAHHEMLDFVRSRSLTGRGRRLRRR